MLFNSYAFLVFFTVFLILYYLFRNIKLQNLLCLIGSYLFYSFWDWRFTFLLAFSSCLDYTIGRYLSTENNSFKRKQLLLLSVFVNLGILGFFKYYDFFVNSMHTMLLKFGYDADIHTLNVILPVGISFYTFQSMSYTIDIYRKQMKPEKSLVNFLAYVSFFPQLVAGPIERAKHLLPQFSKPRFLKKADVDAALWYLSYGFFLKVVVADSLAQFANSAFVNQQTSGWIIILGTLAFGFQIYADFNGYSLIARGCGRLLGFNIMYNFNLPYFAVSLREFWHRWHISLSSWLRDYLYIPLGGNEHGTLKTLRNLFVTMFLAGLWHGAAWHFVAWGILHGIGLVVSRIFQFDLKKLPLLSWALTFCFVCVSWFLFRITDFSMFEDLIRSLSNMEWRAFHTQTLQAIILLISVPALIEFYQWRKNDLESIVALPFRTRYVLITFLLFWVVIFFERFKLQFIYFQF